MNLHCRESDHEGVADSNQSKERNRTEDLAFKFELTLKDSASAFDAFESQKIRAEFNDGIQ